MKKTLILFALLVSLIFASNAKSEVLGSTYVIDSVNHRMHQEYPYFHEESIDLNGHFAEAGIYDTFVNDSKFLADITFVYGDYVFAIDYGINRGQKNDESGRYAQTVFSNWYKNEYKQLCKLQGKDNAPHVPYWTDMFYLQDNRTRFSSDDGILKIVNTKTGETFEYDMWDTDIRRQTFILQGYVNFSEENPGLHIVFVLYPEVMRADLRNFLANFPISLTPVYVEPHPIQADRDNDIVQRSLQVGTIKNNNGEWVITGTMLGEEDVTFVPLTNSGKEKIHGKIDGYSFTFYPVEEAEVKNKAGEKFREITNAYLNIEKNGYVILQGHITGGKLTTNYSYDGPRQVTFSTEGSKIDWSPAPVADQKELLKLLSYIK